jgi:urease accessory protein
MKPHRLLSLTALLLAPVAAQAHPGHGLGMNGTDFLAGLAHPLTGLDHLAAMLAVGASAARGEGARRWLPPAAFVAMMLVGAVLAPRLALRADFVEQGIAASLVVFGLMLATTLPLAAGLALTGAFALFHGVAHGTEAPGGAASLNYLLGFALATASLHAIGLLATLRLTAAANAAMQRVSGVLGAGVAAGGVALLF